MGLSNRISSRGVPKRLGLWIFATASESSLKKKDSESRRYRTSRASGGAHRLRESRPANHSRGRVPISKPHKISSRFPATGLRPKVSCKSSTACIPQVSAGTSVPDKSHWRRDWRKPDKTSGTSGIARNGGFGLTYIKRCVNIRRKLCRSWTFADSYQAWG
jgi:hypothetical protein